VNSATSSCCAAKDVPLPPPLADTVFQDLVGVDDPTERKRRIIAAAERQSQATVPPPRPLIGLPPRIASFTGRAEELAHLAAILHNAPLPDQSSRRACGVAFSGERAEWIFEAIRFALTVAPFGAHVQPQFLPTVGRQPFGTRAMLTRSHDSNPVHIEHGKRTDALISHYLLVVNLAIV
jgi:hypothetical protein